MAIRTYVPRSIAATVHNLCSTACIDLSSQKFVRLPTGVAKLQSDDCLLVALRSPTPSLRKRESNPPIDLYTRRQPRSIQAWEIVHEAWSTQALLRHGLGCLLCEPLPP